MARNFPSEVERLRPTALESSGSVTQISTAQHSTDISTLGRFIRLNYPTKRFSVLINPRYQPNLLLPTTTVKRPPLSNDLLAQGPC